MSTATGRVLLDAEQLGRTLPASATRSSRSSPPSTSCAWSASTPGACPLAQPPAPAIAETTGVDVPVGALDITFYRDDVAVRGAEAPAHPQPVVKASKLDFPLEGRTVVLVDDVLFTGRTIRAAHRRALRLRPARPRAARGARRPRPSRAADPRRLRGQEPADGPQRAGDGAAAGGRRGRRGVLESERPERRRTRLPATAGGT